MALNQSKSVSRSPNAVGPRKSTPSVLSRVILAHGGEIFCLPKSHHDTGGGGGLGCIFSYQYGLVPLVFMKVTMTA